MDCLIIWVSFFDGFPKPKFKNSPFLKPSEMILFFENSSLDILIKGVLVKNIECSPIKKEKNGEAQIILSNQQTGGNRTDNEVNETNRGNWGTQTEGQKIFLVEASCPLCTA